MADITVKVCVLADAPTSTLVMLDNLCYVNLQLSGIVLWVTRGSRRAVRLGPSSPVSSIDWSAAS
jgi:hypothetical protein